MARKKSKSSTRKCKCLKWSKKVTRGKKKCMRRAKCKK